MQTLTEIRDLLKQRGLRPKHRLGQNFLHDQNKIRMLIDAALAEHGRDARATATCATDVVLEVGPGTGTLTEALLERGAEVIACELDPAMADIIEERVKDRRFSLVRGDALQKQRLLNSEIVAALAGRPFKLIANLPYNVASPLITTLLIEHDECTGQFVTIQREVADRLMAAPGGKDYGPLSIIVQALADVKRITTLPPSCFWPEPKVESAMIAMFPSPPGRGVRGEGVHDLQSAKSRNAFARFVTQLFTKRRKQLGTIFGRQRTDWPKGVTPNLRSEALTVEQMINLWMICTPKKSA